MSLEGAVCLVTGAGSGIGRAVALHLAKKGAQVVAVGRTIAKLRAVVDEIKDAGGWAIPRAIDVSSFESTGALATEVQAMLGTIRVLVNSAGTNVGHRRLLSTTPEEIRSIFDTNVLGTMACTRAIVPQMLEADRGTVINVASLAGLHPSVHSGMAYGVSKAAVIAFTRYLNKEFRLSGLRFVALAPGEVDTPLLDVRPNPPDAPARAMMVSAEQVADIVGFVADLPEGATVTELVVIPTRGRDYHAEREDARRRS
jgi:NADP-dependent 3-hydroxy acid dehydrogenase YdfG